MAADQIKPFIDEVRGDDALQAKLRELKGTDINAAIDEIVSVASGLGYEFTADEYKEHYRSELTEEDLKGMAGGISIDDIFSNGPVY